MISFAYMVCGSWAGWNTGMNGQHMMHPGMNGMGGGSQYGSQFGYGGMAMPGMMPNGMGMPGMMGSGMGMPSMMPQVRTAVCWQNSCNTALHAS
jgi:hypothetical protein